MASRCEVCGESLEGGLTVILDCESQEGDKRTVYMCLKCTGRLPKETFSDKVIDLI